MRVCVPVVVSIKPWLAIAVVFSSLLTACDVGCESACRKVLKCDGLETNELSVGECNAECIRQSQLYEDQEDEEAAKAFTAHKNCLKRSSCDEILDGEGYDSEMFSL